MCPLHFLCKFAFLWLIKVLYLRGKNCLQNALDRVSFPLLIKSDSGPLFWVIFESLLSHSGSLWGGTPGVSVELGGRPLRKSMFTWTRVELWSSVEVRLLPEKCSEELLGNCRHLSLNIYTGRGFNTELALRPLQPQESFEAIFLPWKWYDFLRLFLQTLQKYL